MDNKKIGLFIANLRKDKNMTQKDLASQLYVSDKAVSKWERGINLPDITLIEKIADILEVDVSEILKGEKIETEIESKEKIVIDSIPSFQKKYFKKTFIKIMIIIIIGLTMFYTAILVIGELNNGKLSWSVWGNESFIEVPSFTLINAKRNTKRFINALATHDYDVVDNMLIEHPSREFDHYTDWISHEDYFNILKALNKEGLSLKSYKLLYCQQNHVNGAYSLDYNCAFSLIFNYNKTKYLMGVELVHLNGKISFNRVYLNYDNYHHWVNKKYDEKLYESIYNLENREMLSNIEKLFFQY